MTLIHDSDTAVIAEPHSPFFVTIQKVEGFEQLDIGLYSSNRNKANAVIEAVVSEGRLHLSSMCSVIVTKRVLHILDNIDSDPDDDGLVSSCVKAIDGNDCAHIVLIALGDLDFIVLLCGWTHTGSLVGLSVADYVTG